MFWIEITQNYVNYVFHVEPIQKFMRNTILLQEKILSFGFDDYMYHISCSWPLFPWPKLKLSSKGG